MALIAGAALAAGAAGGALSAAGTASAQKSANKTAALQAGAQSAQSWFNYLASRGINLQQLVAQFPDLQQTYQEALARGDKRDFNAWLYAALQAAPNHPIWDAIANPAGTAGAANTTLPAWAVDAQGNPLQPSILQQLVDINSGANNPATAPVAGIATVNNVRALFEANPGLREEITTAVTESGDSRSPEQWLVDHISITEAGEGGGRYTNALRTFLTTPEGAATTGAVPAGPAGTGNNTTLDPEVAKIIPQATTTLAGVFDGTQLADVLKGLEPIMAARDAEAAAQQARVIEQRGLSTGILDSSLSGIDAVRDARLTGAGSIFDATMTGAGGVRDATNVAAQGVYEANVTKLADLLGVRREAAQAIYDASSGAAGGVRDARTTGARGIYDAELTQADTYGQAANQALSRLLAEQSAERARRGFTGGSSGSDMTRARLNADYLQRGASARAGAGVNYQGRLSEAGVGYATDIGRAGVGRATTIGAAQEQDAAQKLNAAVQLAQTLGLSGVNYANTTGAAGVTRATTIAGAGEQDAIARLNAQVADATRRLGYLTADADIARANADLKNAQDQLAALTADQNRKIGAVGAPFSLAGMDLSLKGELSAQPYAGLDELLKRLNSFQTTPATGPQLVTAAPQPVLNTSQIIGGALSGIGSAAGNYASNQSLQDLIMAMRQTQSPTGFLTPAGNVGVQTDWTSVFADPKD